MPPKTGEKRKMEIVKIDWDADLKAEQAPDFLRKLGKKLKTEIDYAETWRVGFPKRDYKACPAHLNKVADKLDKQFEAHKKLLEASAPKPLKDPTTKIKPGPIPHHLNALIADTTPASEQGHFRWESHVDLLVGSLLIHCFPLEHMFYVGAQQTYMTGTTADAAMMDLANAWSMCVEPLDTTMAPDDDRAPDSDRAPTSARAPDPTEAPDSVRVPGSLQAGSDEDNTAFAESSFFGEVSLTSTPLPQRGQFFPQAKAHGERWDGLLLKSFNIPAVPDLMKTSPHPNAMNPPPSSSSAAPIAAASATLQLPPSGSRVNASVFNASPLPTVHGGPSSETGPAEVWDNANNLFLDRTAPNPAHAPPPPIVLSPPAAPSSSSSAALFAAAPTTSQMISSGSQANPVVAHDGSVPVTFPSSPGIEPDLSQDEIPSFYGHMPEMPNVLREVLKDPPSELGKSHVVDSTGRIIFNQSGPVKMKRPDFRVSLLDSETQQMFKNLVIVEDKLRSSVAAVAQLVSYMEELEEGGGNRLALGLAVVLNNKDKLQVAMFRREKEDGPIRNIGGTYERGDGERSCVQFKWFPLNSAEVREQLLVIWQEEMDARGLVQSP